MKTAYNFVEKIHSNLLILPIDKNPRRKSSITWKNPPRNRSKYFQKRLSKPPLVRFLRKQKRRETSPRPTKFLVSPTGFITIIVSSNRNHNIIGGKYNFHSSDLCSASHPAFPLAFFIDKLIAAIFVLFAI